METVLDGLNWFVGLGSSVVLPVLIFVFGVALGTKPGKAFTSGLQVGIGFIAINLVISLMSDSLGPAAQQMAESFGLSLTSIDVGGPAAQTISYSTLLGISAIPIGVIVNCVLLLVGLTKTLDVDLWNYWHAAFIASLAYVISGSYALGIAATVVYMLMIFLFGDILAPRINAFYGFGNVTFPHGTSAPGYFIALPLNWLFDKIPGLNKIHTDYDSISKKFGVFGNTSVIGLIIGLAIGAMAGYGVRETLNVGVSTAAVMVLMPKMVSLIMEGLMPISEAAQEFIQKRFPGKDLYIGMDSALSVGHPAVLASSLVLIPITIALAIVLPGNQVLPFADLSVIPFMVCLMCVAFNGDIVKTILGGTVYMAAALGIATYCGPLITSAATIAGYDLGSYTSITVLSEGGLWTTLVYVVLTQLGGWIGIIGIGLACLAGLVYVNRIKPKRQAAAVPAAEGSQGDE